MQIYLGRAQNILAQNNYWELFGLEGEIPPRVMLHQQKVNLTEVQKPRKRTDFAPEEGVYELEDRVEKIRRERGNREVA